MQQVAAPFSNTRIGPNKDTSPSDLPVRQSSEFPSRPSCQQTTLSFRGASTALPVPHRLLSSLSLIGFGLEIASYDAVCEYFIPGPLVALCDCLSTTLVMVRVDGDVGGGGASVARNICRHCCNSRPSVSRRSCRHGWGGIRGGGGGFCCGLGGRHGEAVGTFRLDSGFRGLKLRLGPGFGF